MKKRFLLLAFILCKQMALFSQYSIHGIVKDEKGIALIGANVLVDQTNIGASTGLNGEFLISGMKPGDYTLHITYIGYEQEQKKVSIKSDLEVEISLSQKSYIADEVIISAIRASENSPVTKSTITKEEIKGQNLGLDIPYLMAFTPSLVTSSDAGAGIGYTNFRIRGTDLNRINITINGIPLNDAESHGVYWVDLPDMASSVENIQIQRGVGTSSQGAGAFGASINLQTLNLNRKPYAEITNSIGSFNSMKNTVSFGSGLINDHFTFDGRLSKISSDGYIDRAWSKMKSFYVSGGYYSSKTLVKLNIFSGIESTYQAWDGIPSDILPTNRTYNGIGTYTDKTGQVRYYDNETDNYQHDNFQLHLSHAFSNSLNINISAHYTIGKGYYEQYKEDDDLYKYQLNNVIIGNDTITKSNIIRRKWLDNDFYGFTWSVNYTKSNITLSAGGGWNQYYGEHYGRVRWAEYMSNGEIDHQYYFSSGTKNDFNAFVKSTYNVSAILSFYADVQYRNIFHSIKGIDDKLQYDGSIRNITQKHEFNFFNPKAGFNFTIDDQQSIYGYVGIAHREPNRDNFVDANPLKSSPKPESLTDYELGYRFKSAPLQAGVNFYYMDYTDQLVLTGMINDVGSPIMTNVKNSYRAGVEFTAGAKLSKKVIWNGNATLSNNIVKNFKEYIDNWDTWGQDSIFHTKSKLAFSPSIILGSQFTFILKPLSISLLSKYVGKQYIDNTNSESRKLHAYFINDIRVNANILAKGLCRINAVACVYNILSEKYEANAWVYQYTEGGQNKVLDGYFPQAGRNFMIGISLEF